MNTNDIRSQKIYEALETLPLSEKELEQAEAYVLGEAIEGMEAKEESDLLTQFSFQDLSHVPSDKIARLFRDLSKRNRSEELTRLFNLLFAIGQSTSGQLIPLDMITWNKSGLRCEKWKKLALYGQMMARNQYQLTGHSLTTLLNLTDGEATELLKAVNAQREKKSDSKLILLAAYFLCKYPNRDALEENGGLWKEEEKQSGGLLAAFGRLFSRKKNGKDTEPDDGDVAVMKQYEDLMLALLSDFFRNQIHMPNAIKILEDIKNDQVTERTLQMAGKNSRMSQYTLSLLGGTAYLNFPLSALLRNVVKIFFAANLASTLGALVSISLGTSMDLMIRGGNFDRTFDIPPSDYIRFLALKSYNKLLKIQLQRNEGSYLAVIDQIDIQPASEMLEIIKEEKPDLYQKLRAERQRTGNNKQKEKVIAAMVSDLGQHVNEVKDYLRENCEIETLYPFADSMSSGYSYRGYQEWNVLSAFEKNYMDEEFVRRCIVVMLFQKAGSLFVNMLRITYSDIDTKKFHQLFQDLEKSRVNVSWQLSALALIYDAFYSESQKERIVMEAKGIFEKYLEQKREETLIAFSQGEAVVRSFALSVLKEHPEENKQEILSYSTDSSKAVKENLLYILQGQKGWEEEVKAFLSSKKAGERELAVRTLLYWQGEEKTYQDLFTQALEKEKNAKMRLLLQEVLQLTTEGAEGSTGGKPVTKTDLVKELHKGGRKRSLAWAYDGTPFSEVHKKNGELADEEYLQAILICYSSVDGCGVSKNAALLAEELKPEELAIYVNELFDKWMAAGAEAKKRWVLYAAAIHGGAEIIQKLQHQLTEWPQNSRGAIAAEAVQALSLNPLPQALLIVDGISRKFKFKQVKSAAVKALEFAASQLGITTEELADRIVPDMGFDENVERKFDYGTRSFTVTMTPALEIEVYDESGKKLKNLPSPGKRDDEETAKAAYEEFKQMKKQMKLTVSSQKQRLEMALSTGREWTVDAWKALFVKNPVMHQFAIGLIWGTYNEQHELLQSFRYMEDGSFNTEEEDEYELPEATYKIGLVHPTELSAESRETWKEQLSDYEITQPFEQLERTIYQLSEEEKQLQRLERFGGCIVNDLSLNGKLLGMGWYRGSVVDGGGFYVYYREDAEIGLGVELYFSGTYVSPYGEDVTIYDARFYKPGEVERGSYVYDEVDKKRAIFLRDVPSRYFSEIVWQLTRATASSQERDESWSNDWPKEK